MSQTFNVILTPHNSTIYLKACVLLYGLADFYLLFSGWPGLVVILAVACVTFCALCVIPNQNKRHSWVRLSQHEKYWLLERKDGSQKQYQRVLLRVDLGFFMRLELLGNNQRTSLYLFRDQLIEAQYRLFRMALRCQKETTSQFIGSEDKSTFLKRVIKSCVNITARADNFL